MKREAARGGVERRVDWLGGVRAYARRFFRVARTVGRSLGFATAGVARLRRLPCTLRHRVAFASPFPAMAARGVVLFRAEDSTAIVNNIKARLARVCVRACAPARSPAGDGATAWIPHVPVKLTLQWPYFAEVLRRRGSAASGPRPHAQQDELRGERGASIRLGSRPAVAAGPGHGAASSLLACAFVAAAGNDAARVGVVAARRRSNNLQHCWLFGCRAGEQARGLCLC